MCVSMLVYIDVYMCECRYIGMMVRVFANRSGDLSSIPDQVIPKTQKWCMMPPCLTLRVAFDYCHQFFTTYMCVRVCIYVYTNHSKCGKN